MREAGAAPLSVGAHLRCPPGRSAALSHNGGSVNRGDSALILLIVRNRRGADVAENHSGE